VQVKVVGAAGETKVDILQLSPSEFEVTYLAPQPGDYLITIFIYGRNILGQPLKAIVEHSNKPPAKGPIATKAKPLNPAKCLVLTETGKEGLISVYDDDGPLNFKVAAKDDDGNLLTGVPCEVLVSAG